MDPKLYRSTIGSLLYLTASRPDIMFSVCLYARYQSNPKESHMKAVKRILRYIKGTPKMGLWYPKGSDFGLIGFSDLDFVGCKVNQKSTSRGCQFLGRSLFSWSSKKQNCVALSTAEAEYMAARACCAQTLLDYGLVYDQIPLYCDSESAISMELHKGDHTHAKHIEVKHHFIQDHVAKKDIELKHVGTHDQLADIFTNPLDKKTYRKLRGELNVLNLSNFE